MYHGETHHRLWGRPAAAACPAGWCQGCPRAPAAPGSAAGSAPRSQSGPPPSRAPAPAPDSPMRCHLHECTLQHVCLLLTAPEFLMLQPKQSVSSPWPLLQLQTVPCAATWRWIAFSTLPDTPSPHARISSITSTVMHHLTCRCFSASRVFQVEFMPCTHRRASTLPDILKTAPCGFLVS